MSTASTSLTSEIDLAGFAILSGVFDAEQVARISDALSAALSRREDAIHGDRGEVYAARNIIALWPGVADVWKAEPLRSALFALLGAEMGLVRALYFDKPPGQSWALPWHKDMTLAVRDNTRPTSHFRKPTVKGGVPHVEGSEGVLASMLTARLHLDDVTDENGPLKVVVGSHRTGKSMTLGEAEVRTLHATSGDVLLIRPLVAHCSNRSLEGTRQHRRILHLEFASSPMLPDGYEWHDYLR